MTGRRMVMLLALACAGCGDDEELRAGGTVAPIDDYALAAPVEVRLDEQRVPHLLAQTDLDAIYAQGYQQATDALFMLEVTRRSARGTLAEVLGESALQGDRQARTFGFSRLGEASRKLMREKHPADHNLLVAYVAGINRRIAEVEAGEQPAPAELASYALELEPWTPADALAIGIRIQLGFSSTLSFDLLYTLVERLVKNAATLPVFKTYGDAFIMGPPKQAKWVLPGATPAPLAGVVSETQARQLFDVMTLLYLRHGMGEGSNSWAVAGAHTDNGRPYLANDSHAGFTDPNRMHVCHVSAEQGTIDAVGFSFLGLPGVHVGHNSFVAWGATTSFADATDLWEVDVDGESVSLGGASVTLATRSEVIRLRNADGSMSELPFDVREVPGHGVLLPAEVLPVPKALISSRDLLLGWPGFEGTDELAMFFGMNRAKNLDELEAAVGLGRTGMQNWLSASRDDIRLQVHGLVPDRGAAEGRPKANRIMDGAAPENLWGGAFLPAERLPRLDGARSFIVTANNDPWGHTADNDPLNDEFYYGSFFAPGFRARRLMDVLADETAQGALGRARMHELQMDVASTLAADWVPRIAAAVAAIGKDPLLAPFVGRPELAAAAAELSAWDGRMTRSSSEAALFRVLLAFASKATLEPSLAFLFDGVDEAQPVTIQKMALLVHTLDLQPILQGRGDLILVTALSDALAETTKKKGTDASFTWGDLHRAVFKKPDVGETLIATDGDDSTLNVAQSRCWDKGGIGEHCRSTAGAVYRVVYGFDDDGTPRATFAVPAANAGKTEDWVEGAFHPLRFRAEEVKAASVESRTLLPD